MDRKKNNDVTTGAIYMGLINTRNEFWTWKRGEVELSIFTYPREDFKTGPTWYDAKCKPRFQISKSSRKLAIIIYFLVCKCYLTKTNKYVDLGFNLVISYWK